MWHALMGPAGLPAPIRQKISDDLKEVLGMPDLRDKMGALGLEANWIGADDFVKLIKSESANMGPLVKDLGIRME